MAQILLGSSSMHAEISARSSRSALDSRASILPGSLLFLLLAVGTVAPAASLEGYFAASWGDPAPHGIEVSVQEFTITGDDGRAHVVELSEGRLAAAGGLTALDRRWVLAEIDPGRPVTTRGIPLLAIQPLRGSTGPGRGVSGTSAWITLPCKFADKTDEQRDLAYFQNMYDSSPGRLDHYWRELSFETVDIDGQAIDWIELPHPQSYYAATPGSGQAANKSALFNDCVAAADATVDFSNGGNPYDGINMMFNDLLDCCAWGGNRYATLDGVNKSWRVTWNPPWAFANETVIAHEMGHGFGLPHSNNSDGDSNPYDNPWDVMSDAWSYATRDATYGILGKHINGYHKARLGWIAEDRRYSVESDGVHEVVLADLARADVEDLQYVTVDIDGSRYYTIETRDFTSYDGALPGHAVVIHEVVPFRGEPAWLIDANLPPANGGDGEGVMWRVGERFEDPSNEIAIEVRSVTAEGFALRIERGSLGDIIFRSGFEEGDLSPWSDAQP